MGNYKIRVFHSMKRIKKRVMQEAIMLNYTSLILARF
jgi:hypothetical protein